jgi:hypothetical protein
VQSAKMHKLNKVKNKKEEGKRRKWEKSNVGGNTGLSNPREDRSRVNLGFNVN